MNARPGTAHPPGENALAAVPVLDRVAFLILLAVLCARPLISESFERVELSFLPGNIPRGTSPATVVYLDTLLLVGAALAWIRGWLSAPRLSVVSAGLGLLLIAVVVSTAAANDKRLAANAAAHLFLVALATTALVRVIGARWMVHLLVAACLASGATNAVKCIAQRTYELDETLEYWQRQKASLAERGVDVNTPTFVNYERRLKSAEAFGYLSHPNVTASCLMMCVLAAGGVLVGVLREAGLDANRRAAAALVAAALCGLLVAGLWLTASMGATGAALLAGLLLLLIGAAYRRVAARPRAAFAWLAIAYAGLIAAGLGYGLLRGTLPHTSLAFRWQYWQAAGRTLADAPLTGAGRENFRAAYLLHKSPESTEEVTNPHNLWLSLLVELGPLGLIAGVLLLGAVLHRALAGFVRAASQPGGAGVGVIILAAIGVLLFHALFSGERFSAPGVPLLWAAYVAGVWILAFVAAFLLVRQVDEAPSASAWLAAGLCAALCAALIHNLIGFALFTPAGLAVFAAFAAGAAAVRAPAPGRSATGWASEPGARRVGVPRALALAALIAAYAWFVAIPTVRLEAVLNRITADVRAAQDYAAAHNVLRQGLPALRVDPWNAEAALHLANAGLEMATLPDVPQNLCSDLLDAADGYASLAEQNGTRTFRSCQLRARILDARAELTGELRYQTYAAETWDEAVARYPTNPRARICAGSAFFLVWRETNRPDPARAAVEHLSAALAIDGTRLPEVAVKLRPAELAAVHRQLDELAAAGFRPTAAGSAASAPSP